MKGISRSSSGGQHRTRKIVIAALFGLVILLAGCTVTYEADITSDGEFEQVSVEVDMGEQLYQTAADQADSEGYDSVAEFVFSDDGQGDNQFDESQWDSVEYSDDGESTVGITAQGGTDETSENVTITVDDEAGEITYVDTEGVSSQETDGNAQFGEIEWTYTVNMPGAILDTNGNTEGSGTVTWTSDEHANISEYRATSEQTGAGGDSDSGFGPGFGVTSAILAILAVLGLGLLGRNRA